MYKRRLKFRVPYGMSTTHKSFRPHLLDLRNSKVVIYEGYPEFTRYEIRWQCGKTSASKVRFLSRLPEGVTLCRACQQVRDRIEFYEAAEKIMGESWQATQSPAPF
jgi:hypothetical protein